MTNDEIEKIENALQFLSGRCDGAVKPDNVGFNKFDTQYGHWLAAVGKLSEYHAIKACAMLQKYREQLKRSGYDLPVITKEEALEKAQSIKERKPEGKSWIESDRIFVTFASKPDESVRQALKSITGWKWHSEREDKAWSVPANKKSAGQIILTLGKIFPLGDEIINLAASDEQPESQKDDVIISKPNGYLLVSFPNSEGRPEKVAMLKKLGDVKWQPDMPGKPWKIAERLAVQVVEMFPGARVDENVKELIASMNHRAEIRNLADDDYETGLDGLYGFQKAGVRFLDAANGRAIIADEMGLGKTIQALAYLHSHPELRPVIIIVPASLKLNWLREIKKWLGADEQVQILSGQTPAPIWKPNILIINWDILDYWAEKLASLNLAVLIADEAHYAKNKTAKRTKAVIKLAKSIKQVILLTGTPVTNRPVELYPLLSMVNPEAWPSFFTYAKRYCGAYQSRWGWDFSGATNMDELHQMIAPYVVRRMKQDVLKDLPSKRRVSILVDFSDEMKRAYRIAREEIASEVARMSQAQQLVEVEKLKQLAVSCKLPGIIEWIKNFLDGEGKLVVMATHHSTIDTLKAEFPGSVVVDGRSSLIERQDAVDKFQNDPQTRLFIGNIKAAGVGITLTAASDMLFVEYAWTPGDMTQAEDRIHRIGQDESVTIWNAVADETIDQKIVDLLEAKRQVIDMVTDGQVSELDFDLFHELVQTIMSEK